MGLQTTSGNARYAGIPTTFVNWTGHEGTPAAHSMKVFSEISKSPGAGINYEQTGNDGELTGLKTGRYYIDISFSGFAVGSTIANALDINEALPFINDEVTIDSDGAGATHPDADLNGKAYVQSCTGRFTEDNDAVIDMTVRKYITVASNGVPTNVDLTAVTS